MNDTLYCGIFNPQRDRHKCRSLVIASGPNGFYHRDYHTPMFDLSDLFRGAFSLESHFNDLSLPLKLKKDLREPLEASQWGLISTINPNT